MGESGAPLAIRRLIAPGGLEQRIGMRYELVADLTTVKEELLMAHKISLELAHAIPIGNVDIKLPVRNGNTLVGTLTISQGGVDWRKANARIPTKVTWKKFADLMENA
jgi:hypothetical protein